MSPSPTRWCRLPSFRPPTLIAHLLLALCLLQHAVAQETTSSPSPSPTPAVTQMFKLDSDRFFGVRTDHAIARAFRDSPSLEARLQPAFDYLDTVWAAVAKRRKDQDPRACNLYDLFQQDWPTIMKQRVQTFQLGTIDRSCFSRIDVTAAASDGELPSTLPSRARSIFIAVQEATADAFRKANVFVDGNWTRGAYFGMPDRTLKRGAQQCNLASLLAHRVAGKWYVRTAVTNAPRHISQVAYARQYLQSFIPATGNTGLSMTFPSINDSSVIVRASEVVAKWGGTGLAVEGDSFDDPLHPLSTAYRRNLVAVDMASDAVTPSNIAILALPMVMNIVPYAFIADLSAPAMVAYIILTDVFSVIPFIIKGAELIRSAQPTQRDVQAFFSGDEMLGTCQSWTIECTGEDRFRVIGVAFVVVGLIAIVGGIALEMYARRIMENRKKRASISAIDSTPDIEQSYSRFASYFARNNKIQHEHDPSEVFVEGPFGTIAPRHSYSYSYSHSRPTRSPRIPPSLSRSEAQAVQNRQRVSVTQHEA